LPLEIKKTITIKPSFNIYLERMYEKSHNHSFVAYLQNIISACEFIENIKFKINVRGYNNEELMILKNKMPKKDTWNIKFPFVQLLW